MSALLLCPVKKSMTRSLILLILPLLCLACGLDPVDESTDAAAADSTATVGLEEVAASDDQWTGLTFSREGRLFVNFPRWSDQIPASVAEIVDGQLIPWPDARWNDYSGTPASDSQFVCVQSVFVDSRNRLWVLDPANPQFQGVVARGPRLFHFDLSTNRLVRSYSFPSSLIPGNAYLNDVRIDLRRNRAYITDSGAGGLYVIDLESGDVQRRLPEHPSTRASIDSFTVAGYTFDRQIHSDGIALSNSGNYLYYMPLSARTLYRVPVETLVSGTDAELTAAVETVAEVLACDGMLFDLQGNIYMGGLENNSIRVYDTRAEHYRELIQDERIKWADTFTRDAAGNIYFTTSQIHLPPDRRGAYHIYRIVQ